MRILLIGEYSNVHNTLARGLRELGHEVCVVSNGDFWKNYPRDIDVTRKPGKLGGVLLYLRLLCLLPRLRGYDVVQLINPMFFELKAQRLFFFYRWLRRHNRRVVLGAFGMDWYWVHECTFRKPLRYSDFNIGERVRTDEPAVREQQDWLGTEKERLNRMIAEDCDGVVAGLYEYMACYGPLFPQKTRFIPFPIVPATTNDSGSKQSPITDGGPLRIFVGISRSRSQYKGTDIMLKAAQDVAATYPDRVRLQVAEGVPFEQYAVMMRDSDVLLDQLYSYTPAMNALLAMSQGIVVVGGGEPENYEILGETQLRPIVNVEPTYDSVYQELEQLVLHPERVAELKRQGLEYICRHHHYIKVARQYAEFFAKLD
ncbi:MAG: glycosyltransferase family 4 protein [Prevotella sp.]|nr:glycosyltransferase family 4 protein [Prevotella sp.]